MGLEEVGVALIAKGEQAFLAAITKSKNALVTFGQAAGSSTAGTNKLTAGSMALANMLGMALYNSALTAGRAIVGLGKDSIKAASDLNETSNKINVLFGENEKEINAFAATADKALGQSKQSALDGAATFGVFGKSAGLSGSELVGFSTRLVGLSSDLASFYNTSPEEAIQSIGAALRGESEPIRKYGVLLDDATLRQKAMELGITKTTKQALTPQQRVLAAYNTILAQTKVAEGDFVNTSKGFANSQRIIAAQWENMKATLGTAFLPVVEWGANIISNRLMPAGVDLLNKFLIPGVGAAADFGKKFINVMDAVFGLVSGKGISANFLGELLGGGLSVEELSAGMADLPAKLMSYLFGEDATAQIQSFLTFFQPVIAAFQNLFTSISTSGPMVMQTLSNMWSFVITTFTTYGPMIVTQLAGFINQMATFWTAHGAQIMAIIQIAWQFVVTTISVAITLVSTLLNATMAAINGDWSGAWAAIQAGLASAMNSILALVGTNLATFTTVWQTNFEMAKTILVTIFNNAVTYLSGLASEFYTMGVNLITGLWDGMKNRVAAVEEWLKAALKRCVDIANQIFGIQSPSKVFEAIGSNIMLGMVKGIRKQGKTAIDVISGYVEAATKYGDLFTNFVSRGNAQNDKVNAIDAEIYSVNKAIRKGTLDEIAGKAKLAELEKERLQYSQAYADSQAQVAKVEEQKSKLEFLRQQIELMRMIHDAGGNVNQILGGMKLGLNADANGLAIAMQKAMELMIQKAQDTLGVHSPSTVFADIGKNVMKGMAMGIYRNQMAPVAAAVTSSNIVTNNVVYNNAYNLGVTTSQSPKVVTQSYAMMKMLGR